MCLKKDVECLKGCFSLNRGIFAISLKNVNQITSKIWLQNNKSNDCLNMNGWKCPDKADSRMNSNARDI